MRHAEGLGITKDLSQAIHLYQTACGGGDMLSCATLADLYDKGNGVISHPARARELYERACKGDSEELLCSVR